MKLINLQRQRFGKLVVRGLAEKPWASNSSEWMCDCDCGNTARARSIDLRTGNTKSCGCLRREVPANAFRTHGHTIGGYSPTYQSWLAMRQRCRPTHQAYHNYGGRGIVICERWRVFENFLTDMGERPEGLTLDRINNDGDYEPGNCRWATWKEQACNKRKAGVSSSPR